MVARRAKTLDDKVAVLARVLRVWLAHPELRLGQLIGNAQTFSGSALTMTELLKREDRDLVEDLEKFSRRVTRIEPKADPTCLECGHELDPEFSTEDLCDLCLALRGDL